MIKERNEICSIKKALSFPPVFSPAESAGTIWCQKYIYWYVFRDRLYRVFFIVTLFMVRISVNKARLVLTRTLQLALSWNSPTFSYFFIFLTFFFTNEEKTKNPPGALETRDVALQDDHKKERKRRVQHRYTMLNENMILNFKTGRENSIC